ncbi:MAG: alpha/beta hydrolase [Chitinophagaceae bacterium]|nr:alpha/beta hydrolase [Chitinophagaceae bacterium]
MLRYLAFLSAALILVYAAPAQNKPMELDLYPANQIPNNIPGANQEKSDTSGGILRISNISRPTLTVFLPDASKANGTAVVICPGGGYAIVAAGHEGYDVAKKFNEMGVAAFVLKYRLPNAKNQPDPSIAPLQDAQQALLTVRQHAKKWHINPDRVGIMGFSAGGHLASTGGTHYDKALVSNPANISVRPNFMVLIYPVISSGTTIGHAGSFKNLLGENASAGQLNNYSNELQVNETTPPAFLVHASDDGAVPPDNSIVFYHALIKNKVPAEMHIYQSGGHGFGMHNPTTKDAWMNRLKNWMDRNGWLKK